MKYRVFLCAVALHSVAWADVYQCSESDGSLTFSDAPCGKSVPQKIITDAELKRRMNSDLIPLKPSPAEQGQVKATEDTRWRTIEGWGYVGLSYATGSQAAVAVWAASAEVADDKAKAACQQKNAGQPCAGGGANVYSDRAPEQICIAHATQTLEQGTRTVVSSDPSQARAEAQVLRSVACQVENCAGKLTDSQCVDVQELPPAAALTATSSPPGTLELGR